MSSHTPLSRPVKTIVFYFLTLCGVAMAVAVVTKAGFIDGFAEKRALGLIVGMMAVAVGNSLPKVRPLQGWFANASQAMVAERFAGWTLVLAGITEIALFLFVPLDQARTISALAGICALLMIAADWSRLGSSAVPQGQPPADKTGASSKRSAAKRRILAMLLFAFLYLFVSACAAFLFSQQPWFREFGLWMMNGFFFLYVVLRAFLDHKRPAGTHLAAQ
jgi:hypothetical protein